MVERQKQEFDIIANCVNFSLGQHWFRIHNRNDNYLYLDIVPIPRGHVTLFAPVSWQLFSLPYYYFSGLIHAYCLSASLPTCVCQLDSYDRR